MDRDDQAVDNYLDNILGTEDGSEPEDVRDETESDEAPTRGKDSSFFGDEFDEDDEDEGDDDGEDAEDDEDDDEEDADGDDEDEEEGGDEDAPDQDAPALTQGEARLKAIAEAVQAKQLEAAQELKRQQTAQNILNIKANSTDEEWKTFTDQFVKFVQQKEVKAVEKKLHDREVVIAAYQMTEQLEQEAREYEAGQSIALTAAEQSLGRLSATEKRLLEGSTPDNFLENFEFIKSARSQATEPARQKLRENRQAKGADRPPIRETGGARSVRKDYDNFTNVDAFFDDLFPESSVPARR